MNETERVRRTPPMPSLASQNSVLSGPGRDASAGPARMLSQAAEAIAEFEGIDSSYVALLLRNATVLTRAGEHRLAINLFRNVLMSQPDNAEALKGMGLSLREDGRFEEALKCFRALVRGAMPDTRVSSQALLAETLYLCERDEMALGAYRDVLKNSISDQQLLFDVYKNVGNIYVRAGDFEAAEEFYNKAYTINPNSDVLMVNYGTLEIQRDALAEAVSRFRRAVEIQTNNDKAWVGLALVHRQMGDLELAWANVQRALDINKKNRTALRLVVEWSMQDHMTSLAVSRLQDYLAVEGEDGEMSFILAKILIHSGHLVEARLEMERVLALDPMAEGGIELLRALERADLEKR